jgi:hypothetical protein
MLVFLRISASLFLILELAAGFGLVDLWGMHHLAAFSLPVVVLIVVVAMLLVWLPSSSVSRATRFIKWKPDKHARYAVVVSILTAMGGLFYFLRSENLLLGDGYKRVEMMTRPLEFWPTEYVDLALHWLVSRLIGSPEGSYILISILTGLLFMVTVWAFASQLSMDRIGKLSSIMVVFSIAQMQFFFGYVESYAVMTLLVAVFLVLGYRCLSEQTSILWVVVLFVAAGLFHMSAWFLLPGLLYLFWHKSTVDSRPLLKVMTAAIVVAAAALAVLYYLNFEGEKVFVPLTGTAQNPYSLLSSEHLGDIVNALLMVAPLPLMLTAVILMFPSGRLLFRRPEVRFLALSAAGAFGIVVFVDPVLGAVRDWDLMALFGVPLAFLSVAASSMVFKRRNWKFSLLAIACAIIVSHSLPWIVSNTDEIKSKDLLKKAIARDVHYSSAYYDGFLIKAWCFHLLNDPFYDYAECDRAFPIRLSANPNDALSRVLYARSAYFVGKFEEAALALNAGKHYWSMGKFTTDIMRLFIRLDMLDRFTVLADSVAGRMPDDLLSQYYYQVSVYLQESPDAVIGFYQSMITEKPQIVWLIIDAAAFAIDFGMYDLALTYLELAESRPNLMVPEKTDIAAVRMMLDRKIGH